MAVHSRRDACHAKMHACHRPPRDHARTPSIRSPLFRRWYRHPAQRVAGQQALDRKVRLAVAMAEYYLGRPLRSVLDVGCGEGTARAAAETATGRCLPRHRPSEYVVARYGVRRNLQQVRFGQLEHLRFGPGRSPGCCDVMQSCRTRAAPRPVGIRRALRWCGVVDVFCREDDTAAIATATSHVARAGIAVRLAMPDLPRAEVTAGCRRG